jgi:Tol biopolymer transport system component
MIFVREENGRRNMWRADADGRNGAVIGPTASTRVTLTADSKNVIYISSESGTQSMWIRPIAGGPPRQVANVFAYYPAASPDGKSVAFVSVNEKNQAVISVCSLPECSSRQTFATERGPTALQWTADGRGIAYSTPGNIWVQPRDGGAQYQLTRFAEGDRRIEDFEWSRDGRRLAISRSKTTWDIVLFRSVPRD